MRIVCPACAAVYQVPDSLLEGESRAVRCARCGDEWVPQREAQPLPAAAPAELSTAMPSLAERAVERGAALDAGPANGRKPTMAAPPPPADARLAVFPPLVGRPPAAPGRALLAAGWVASAAVLLVLLGAAYLWRAQVQAAWPPSQRAYLALGLR